MRSFGGALSVAALAIVCTGLASAQSPIVQTKTFPVTTADSQRRHQSVHDPDLQ